MKRQSGLAMFLGTLFLAHAWATPAAAKSTTDVVPTGANGPPINPFECYGRWESATGSRTASQMELELQRKRDLLEEPGEPGTVKAMKLCVVAKLKERLGHDDVDAWFEKAVAADPEEPGYELFWARYWGNARGASQPVRELSELHYRRALAKLAALRAAGTLRDYHAEVESWVQKGLAVLRQQDGVPLTPWNVYPYRSAGRWVPELSVAGEFRISRDTRDFFNGSEMRTFTGEVAFAQSDLRANRALSSRERWDLARAPIRMQFDTRARLTVGPLGSFDATYSNLVANAAQIVSFYAPTQTYADVHVQQMGVGWQRVFPLYPLFDLKLEGAMQRVQRRGLTEFLPDRQDEFWMYEAKPSISRFIGTDKLTLRGVWAYLDIAALPGGVPEQAMRQKVIRSGEIEYAMYRPVTLLDGSLHAVRRLTRGWSFYAGIAQDDEVYGLRKVVRDDYYGGLKLLGPGAWDLNLQGTMYTSHTIYVDPNAATAREFTDPSQTFSSYKTSINVQRRLIDPDRKQGVGATGLGFSADSLTIAVPASWEVGIAGRSDYQSVRGGVELWAKVFQFGVGGTPMLLTAGYEYQYFYSIQKTINLVHTAVRVGWKDL